MSEYTKEELEDLQKTLYRLKDIMGEMKKGDVIDFKAAKAKKEKEKEKAKEIIEDYKSSDIGSRHERIRASLDKINKLMTELKAMKPDTPTEKLPPNPFESKSLPLSGNSDTTEKDEMSDQHKDKMKDHIAQLTRIRDHLININDHMSNLKDKAGLGKDKKTDE